MAIDSLVLPLPAGSTEPVFIAGYDSSGINIGAASLESGADDQFGVAGDKFGNVFVVSDYAGTSIGVGPDTLTSGGGESFYLAKYVPSRDTAILHTDTAMCTFPASYTLVSPPGFSSWNWSSGDSSSSTTISSPGIYVLRASGYCSDLIDTFRITMLPNTLCSESITPLKTKQPSVFPNPAHNGDSLRCIFIHHCFL